MTNIKTEGEIEKMAKGGKILAEVLSQVLKNVQVGISEQELDQLAEKLILEKGAEPGFKRVEGYKHTICVSTNDVVVHGIPSEYKFKEGDVVGIDCGVFYNGFHTDMAETIRIKNEELGIKNDDERIQKFLKTGKEALNEAIKAVKAGNRVGHISKIIQGIVEGQGYSIVRSLVGHGVGRELHEEPEIPGFLSGAIEETPKLLEGMTIAIEVIYNMGKKDVVLSKDGWTIRTKDKSTSGVYERTIAVTSGEPLILTA